VIPAVGVYAVLVRSSAEEGLLDGAVNIGYNPTFNRDDLIVEVHVLDYDKDIYGAEVEVYFVERLRDEISFGSIGQLKDQIKSDVEITRNILAAIDEKERCIDPRYERRK